MDIDLLCCLGIDEIKGQCSPNGWRYDDNNTCDNKIIKYCNENSFDPICSCILSKENFPQCQDLNCQKFGYQTNNMKKTKCPNIVTCNQIFKDVEVDKSQVNTQQFQICAGDPEMLEKIKNMQNNKNNQSNPDNQNSQDKDFKLSNKTILFILFICIMILVGLSFYFYTKNKNIINKQSTNNQLNKN